MKMIKITMEILFRVIIIYIMENRGLFKNNRIIKNIIKFNNRRKIRFKDLSHF
jgi:hypothetical protein